MYVRILIVDDEPLAREKLRALLVDEDLEIVGEAVDGPSAVAMIQQEAPDIVLLDVQMPGLDGFGVLQQISKDAMPAVIFVTAHDQFALRAFEVNAIDYLLKPFDRSRLREALKRTRHQLGHRRPGDSDPRIASLLAQLQRPDAGLEKIAVKSSGRIVIVRAEQIDWIESSGNYVTLHTGKTSHLHRETLSSLEKRLSPARFIRISRSIIVNVDRVSELEPLFHGDYSVKLLDGTTLNLSRSHRDRLDQLLEEAP